MSSISYSGAFSNGSLVRIMFIIVFLATINLGSLCILSYHTSTVYSKNLDWQTFIKIFQLSLSAEKPKCHEKFQTLFSHILSTDVKV